MYITAMRLKKLSLKKKKKQQRNRLKQQASYIIIHLVNTVYRSGGNITGPNVTNSFRPSPYIYLLLWASNFQLRSNDFIRM